MPSKPVLSDTDKENIRKRLKELCEECWIAQGYKKTSIKSLCEKAGISVGTFYTLYSTKEDLFFETIETIQRRLEEKIFAINRDRRTKDGFAESMKELLRNMTASLSCITSIRQTSNPLSQNCQKKQLKKLNLTALIFSDRQSTPPALN